MSSYSEIAFLGMLCTYVDTPYAKDVKSRILASPSSAIDLPIDSSHYQSAFHYAQDYLIASYLKKVRLDFGIDREAKAMFGFETSEQNCALTNLRFRDCEMSLSAYVNSVLLQASRKISTLLGPFKMSKVVSGRNWGPGATHDISKRDAYGYTKGSKLPMTVSRRASSYLADDMSHDIHWLHAILGQVPCGPVSLLKREIFSYEETCRVVTVPKDAKKDRTIAIEPTGNMFLQKGVGSFFRSRLKRVGIDLDDQSLNQRLASVAHSEGYATLDLSAASDSVSTELVASLLPPDWFNYLDDIRSHYASVGGVNHKLEKFSSMGNGFTFELESLIFWAISSSVDEKICQIYGDDIIVTQDKASVLTEVLEELGFQVNLDKSFSSGRFFESCGKHFFDGIDVTPIYQKDPFDESPQALISAHNRLIRWHLRIYGYISEELKTLTIYLRNLWIGLYGKKFPKIPFCWDGDDGFVIFLSEADSLSKPSNGLWSVPVLRKQYADHSHDQTYSLALALRTERHKHMPKQLISLTLRTSEILDLANASFRTTGFSEGDSLSRSKYRYTIVRRRISPSREFYLS